MPDLLAQLPDLQRDLRKVTRLLDELEAEHERLPAALRFDAAARLHQRLAAHEATRKRLQARIDHITALVPAL